MHAIRQGTVNRNSSSPGQRIAWAMLYRALQDIRGTNKRHKESAMLYITSRRTDFASAYENICSLVGISPNLIRQYLKKQEGESKCG